jgi:hypothetical protein
MLDLLMLLLLATAFAAAIGYVWACVDLTRRSNALPEKLP